MQEGNGAIFFLAPEKISLALDKSDRRGRTGIRGPAVKGFVVDIDGIRGKLLHSPAPGSLAGPAGLQPRAPRGLRSSSGWTGGWAWKGPGHPVDNGDRARCQRDGLRSEGAARVLFLFRLTRVGTITPAGSFVLSGGTRFAGGTRFVGRGHGSPLPRGTRVRGYHGVHRPWHLLL